jgi:hypothetical protein
VDVTDRTTVQIVAGGLVLIVLVGTAGLFWLIHDVVVEASLIAVMVAIPTTALGALAGLLANSGSVNVGDVKSTAYNKALADVASLAPPAPPAHLAPTETVIMGPPPDVPPVFPPGESEV